MNRAADEAGSASIWVLTFTALVVLSGALVMTIAAIGVGRARAGAAADLAALAGAQHAFDGSACQWAREAANRNAARLASCRAGEPASRDDEAGSDLVGGGDVTVSVTVPVRLPFWPFSTAVSVHAAARAGPTVQAGVASTDRAGEPSPARDRLVVLPAANLAQLSAVPRGAREKPRSEGGGGSGEPIAAPHPRSRSPGAGPPGDL